MCFICAIFGIQVFVHIPKHQQSKMDPKATKCTFIGWDETTKGFCCYNLVNKKILRCNMWRLMSWKICSQTQIRTRNTHQHLTFNGQYVALIISIDIVPFRPFQNIIFLPFAAKKSTYISSKLSIIVWWTFHISKLYTFCSFS